MAPTGTDDAVTFVISVAAELAGMHPQTLRQYDRLGLVIPARTKGRGRRNRVFAASADGQVMPMRRGQRPWDRSSQPAAHSGGSLTVWDPMAAIAAMSTAEPPVRSALPGPAGRAGARAVIEGTIISR